MLTQEALEGYEGHGVFTYTFAQGLAGAADKDKDGFATVNELTDYVEDAVLQIAEKVFKRKQFPYIVRTGNNFPVAPSAVKTVTSALRGKRARQRKRRIRNPIRANRRCGEDPDAACASAA